MFLMSTEFATANSIHTIEIYNAKQIFKGLYTLTGPLPASKYGTPHWDAMKYTHTIMHAAEQDMFFTPG